MNELSLPLPNRLLLIVAGHAAAAPMLELSAALAHNGPLRVVDGGNRFNVYAVARAARRRSSDLRALLERIHLARAFTCHQMLTLLAGLPAAPHPTLVIDLLATFYDESVPMLESERLLRACLGHLRRLSAAAPLVISARPPAQAAADRLPLLRFLQDSVDHAWLPGDTPPPPPAPLRLFPETEN